MILHFQKCISKVGINTTLEEFVKNQTIITIDVCRLIYILEIISIFISHKLSLINSNNNPMNIISGKTRTQTLQYEEWTIGISRCNAEIILLNLFKYKIIGT